MLKGPGRFDYYIRQLQTLLNAAAKQKNAALWLYRNDARTPLFMLEALAKMYAEIHNRKKFTKIRLHFKVLEDALGAIDYYDAIAKDLVNNKKIPVEIIAYLQAESREKIQSLNEILDENGWLNKDDNRLVNIQKKLKEADWMEEEVEIKSIEKFYGKAILDIREFVLEKGFRFSNMETDVHELRRKMRWLSIYPRALQGCIQLREGEKMPAYLQKYLTIDITGSAYNKMPDSGDCKYLLILEQNYFYSLSWMIAQLGELKDKGLHLIAIKEALQLTKGFSEEDAFKTTYKFFPLKQLKLQVLLNEAEIICKAFFKEKNLEHLVIGTMAMRKNQE